VIGRYRAGFYKIYLGQSHKHDKPILQVKNKMGAPTGYGAPHIIK
jgi:hypothetical protein